MGGESREIEKRMKAGKETEKRRGDGRKSRNEKEGKGIERKYRREERENKVR